MESAHESNSPIVPSTIQSTPSAAAESVRGRTGNLQAQLADALESGAGVIRQRASSLGATPGQSATSGGATNVLERVAPQVLAQGELAATAMERGAMWLRENDLGDIEERVMGQLKQNPVRTLGIAAVLGFLVAGRRR